MVAPRLDQIRRVPLPEGYCVCRYQAGDDVTWLRIHRATGYYGDIDPSLHRHEFGTDETLLSGRQLFLMDGRGWAVATATAWLNDPAQGVPGGRLHWVAVVPAFQRRGLASALVGAVADRFEALGETAAYLTTDAQNHNAVALYSALGFQRLR